MSLHLHLKIVGALLMSLSLAHAFFPRRFDWRNELPKLSLLTRQIFLVHYFYIALILFLFGALTLFATDLLLRPDALSRILLAGFTGFWALRLFIQWFVYDRALWRGRRFNTAMHFLFTCVWLYFTLVYLIAFTYCSSMSAFH